MIKDFSATLISKENLSGNVWGFTFEMNEGETLECAPGQYVLLKIEDKYRQYSIASQAGVISRFDLIVEFFPGGLASTYLDGLAVGQAAGFKGPAGIFTLKQSDRPKVFLATGTGIAPVKAMIDTYLAAGGHEHMYLLFGLKTRADMYLFDHFAQLAQDHANFDFDVCLSREEGLDGLDAQHVATGRVNQVYDVAVEEGADPFAADYYLCGSKEIVESLKEYVTGLGVAKEQIHFENFG